MTDLVVWTGPVAQFQVQGATVPGARELFIGCCGDLTPPCKPPTCPTVGEAVRSSPALLLSRAGMTAQELGDLFLGAFSAGGSILKRVLENPDYRAVTTAVLLSDATYTSSWIGNPADRLPPAIEGYVRYATDVALGPGDKLFVATASPSPNKTWATGVENLAAIRREVEARTGYTFEPIGDFYGVDPQPECAFKLGNVIFAEYPMKPLGHGHTAIAPQVWQKILHPWLLKGKGPIESATGIAEPPPPPGKQQQKPPSPSNGIGIEHVLIVLASAAAGYLVADRVMGRHDR